MKRAVFLDRDGTINVEREYLRRVEDFAFIEGSVKAIRRLREAGFLVIVVTNQSGVARGYFDLAEVEMLHQHLQEELRLLGTQVDAFYICPHHPEEGIGEFRRDCDCRKGSPGMLLQAAAEHNIDLRRSFMVGDKVADVEAGLAAGCRALLVLTGHGGKEITKLPAGSAQTAPDLAAAAEWILEKEKEGGVK
jgi:D-glycero-D-manno-heptose 1,7-bisphosphate phosphatase